MAGGCTATVEVGCGVVVVDVVGVVDGVPLTRVVTWGMRQASPAFCSERVTLLSWRAAPKVNEEEREPMELTLDLADDAALAALQADLTAHGALSVPLGGMATPALFARASVTVTLRGALLAEVAGQVVQLLPGDQVAVLVDEGDRARVQEPAAAQAPAASGTGDYSSEPLWARIADMSKAEKLKLAKHGNADARRLILKLPDPMLHQQVLTNPGLTATEVASLIGGGAASPSFIKAALARSELASNLAVMEAMVLSPHTPLHDAIRMVDRISLELARRIAKGGKARGQVVHAAKRRVTR